MDVREKLIELIGQVQDEGRDYSDVVCVYATSNERLADHLLANGVTFTPEIPGPEMADPNIMELCFHNGERHMKEKMLAKLAQLLEGLDYHKAVFICKGLEDL
ncbi:MAG: hypothetical protein IIW56_10335 [Oscillospiraceae bacterium]|nr:hypothetical protein [Oscillospiraceae bacterium]